MASPSEPQNIWSLFLDGLIKVNAWLGGVLGVLIAILIGRFLPGYPVPLWLVAIAGVTILWLFFALLSALKTTHDLLRTTASDLQLATSELRVLSERAVTTVEAAVPPFSPYESAKCVFIVRSGTLPIGSRVIVSTAEAKHERPLGTGCVRFPQQDGKSIVTLDAINKDATPFLDALLNEDRHDKAVLKIRIGPAFDIQNLSPRGSGGTISMADFQNDVATLFAAAEETGGHSWGEDEK